MQEESPDEGSPAHPLYRPATMWDTYEPVYLAHYERLYRLALLLARGNRPVAEDVVSEVLIDAQRPWAAGRVDNFGAYTRRAVVHRFTGQARHASVVERFTQRRHAEDRGQPDLAEDAVNRDALWSALAALPPRQRAAVVLRYYEEMTIDETAEVLGVTAGTVKSQVFDALRAMRREVGERDVD